MWSRAETREALQWLSANKQGPSQSLAKRETRTHRHARAATQLTPTRPPTQPPTQRASIASGPQPTTNQRAYGRDFCPLFSPIIHQQPCHTSSGHRRARPWRSPAARPPPAALSRSSRQLPRSRPHPSWSTPARARCGEWMVRRKEENTSGFTLTTSNPHTLSHFASFSRWATPPRKPYSGLASPSSPTPSPAPPKR